MIRRLLVQKSSKGASINGMQGLYGYEEVFLDF